MIPIRVLSTTIPEVFVTGEVARPRNIRAVVMRSASANQNGRVLAVDISSAESCPTAIDKVGNVAVDCSVVSDMQIRDLPANTGLSS